MRGLLAYYVGADGPTIILGTDSLETLLELKRLLTELRCGERSSVTLADLRGLTVTNIDSLVLQVVKQHPPAVIRRVVADKPAFLWEGTPEDWEDCISLIDPLIESGVPGHQYLTDEYADDAVVELSFRESTC